MVSIKNKPPADSLGVFEPPGESRSVTTGSKPWVLVKATSIYHLCQGQVNIFFDVGGIWGNGPEEFPRARGLGARGCPRDVTPWF